MRSKFPKPSTQNTEALSGLLICLVLCIYTLWLAASNRLALFIHPRYVAFTVIMAAGGLLLVLVALLRGHSKEAVAAAPENRWPLQLAAGLLVALFLTSMLTLSPKPLTSATAEQRGLNSASLTTDSAASALQSFSGDYRNLTVKDWSSLLAQTQDPAYYADKSAEISGFVYTTPDTPAEVFYVARFIVTCCAVDARPVGVPIYQPGWQETYPLDSWVQTNGNFTAKDLGGKTMIVLVPDNLSAIAEPKDPYVY